MKASLVWLGALLLLLPGCAGGLWGYGPGTNGLERSGGGVDPTTGQVHSYRAKSGDIEFGTQLGARVGVGWAKLPGEALSTGLAVDAHADFTLAFPKWGVGLSGGYTADRTGFDDHTWFYSGVPIVAYGQYSLARRFFLHAGGGYVVVGSVKRIEDDTAPEAVGDANAMRGLFGANWVFGRSNTRDLVLRVEARGTKSQSVRVAGRDAGWTSIGVLGEILWVTF
jgi:hypothetical protein